MTEGRIQPGTVGGGRFEIERLANAGGMGDVFRAIDRHSGSPVAVKFVRNSDAIHLSRFEREARALSQFEHPGIVRYIAHGSDPAVFLAMEWLEGEDLSRRLARGPLSTAETLIDAEALLLRDGITSVVQKDGSKIDGIVEEAKRILLEQRRIAKERLPRVLYVEDSAQNRDVVRRYLEGVFEVLEAEDGEHGLARAERELPDLVLMDLSLPRIDGWEATRRLKAGSLSIIPVVALTAHAGREDQARARAAGCDGYLTKPVEREHLIATIQEHLKARRAKMPESSPSIPRSTPRG